MQQVPVNEINPIESSPKGIRVVVNEAAARKDEIACQEWFNKTQKEVLLNEYIVARPFQSSNVFADIRDYYLERYKADLPSSHTTSWVTAQYLADDESLVHRNPWDTHKRTQETSDRAIIAAVRLLQQHDPTTADAEKQELKAKLHILQEQLHCDHRHLQLYRFGATGLVVAVLSILMWYFTGIGAPFHPVFAGLVIPVALGMMAMAVLMKPKPNDGEKKL